MRRGLGPITTPKVTGETTNRERFVAFHRANPHVLELVVRESLALLGVGLKRLSIALVWERLRYLYAVETRSEDFRLPNAHRAYYARVAMAREPRLAGRFATAHQEDGYEPDMAELGLS